MGNSIHFQLMNGCSWESVENFETKISWPRGIVKPLTHQACDHVTTYIRPQNKTNRRWITVKSHDWYQKIWVIVRENLVAARSMIMFKTQDLRLQIARGHKQVVHDRATSHAESYHQSRTSLATDWAIMRLVVPFVEQFDDWLYDLLRSVTTGCTTLYCSCN